MFKRLVCRSKALALAAGMVVTSSSFALATSNWYEEVDLTAGITAATTIAGVILAALAVIWGIKKAISMVKGG